MSWIWGSPQVGDWVATTRAIPVTFADHLMGGDSGLARGTRGVVTGTAGWNRLEVRFDTGLRGEVTARVRRGHVRVTRRGGGVDAFERRASRLNAARAGVALAVLGPVLFFAASWFLQGGTDDGLLVALIDSAIYGVLDLAVYAVANPLAALIYVAVVTLAGRFALHG